MTKRDAEAAELDKQESSESKIFGDPTYDKTFKMIFKKGNEDLIIHFLNSLLNFKEDHSIVSLEVIDPAVNHDDVEGVKSTVDVRCTTKEGKEIAIEMQRGYKQYFLPRTQEYMAKIIAGQVKEGESSLYHLKMRDTYILVIAKEDLFTRDYSLEHLIGKTDKEYEKTVVPYIEELNQKMPGNKMHWKFFELQRFRNYRNEIPEKKKFEFQFQVQWLDFFNNCSKMVNIPQNVDPTIQMAYQIMEISNWTTEQKEKYWAIKSLEAEEAKLRQEEKQAQEKALEEAKLKGKIEGKKEGKKEAEIEAEISKIKDLIDLGITEKQIISKLKIFTNPKIINKLDYNLEYIKDHINDPESVICQELGLFDALLPSNDELKG